MNVQHPFRREEIAVYLNALRATFRRERQAPSRVYICEPAEPRFDAPPTDLPWQPFPLEGKWGRKNGWAYFRAHFQVPQGWHSWPIDLHFRHSENYLEHPQNDAYPAGPEGQVFVNGERAGAIDREHHTIRWPFKECQRYEVTAVFFAGRAHCSHALSALELFLVHEEMETLWRDLTVLSDIAGELSEASTVREQLLQAVEKSLKAGDRRDLPAYPEFPRAARRDPHDNLIRQTGEAMREILDREIKKLAGAPVTPGVTALGHAHIDLAWLWTVEQSRHKCVRTFATQCRLLEQYPGWKFNQSSPQAYAWVEKEAPDLFAKIKSHIAAGRWDAEGAMWVEADTNLPSGESLVRQLLYGKRYFKEKLGVDSKVLWLPDVFGYSAALPQLLTLAGVEGFVTSKLSWSQFNRFPFDTFRWRGIDGTESPVHFISTPTGWGHTATYNGKMTVREVAGIWKEYREKRTGLPPLLTFGYGDGGGGPTEEMIQRALFLSQLPGLGEFPKVQWQGAAQMIREVLARREGLPVWDGELYLEYHRGTYTTQGWLKRAHRKNEALLHLLEWVASLAVLHGFVWEKARADELWKEFLLLQFHDILPGSSVGEVYDQARLSHGRILSAARELLAGAARFLSEKIDASTFRSPLLVFNALSWERNDPFLPADGVWRDGAAVPAGGWTVIDAAAPPAAGPAGELSAAPDGRSLKNKYWHIAFNERGEISSLRDLQNNREVLPPGKSGNVWQVFEDRPMKWDAWDIDLYYRDHPLPAPVCASIQAVETGPVRASVEIVWQIPPWTQMPLSPENPSRIVQRAVLYRDYPRIDFETFVEWHEHHALLKVAFPVDVRATEATYQIQFGHLKRPTHFNTSWDLARFEVCGHQFADLSEHGYGLSLLNDCKYGHDIHEGVLRLTCIKSPQAPHREADQGEHHFIYSLLPHAGSFQEAQVLRRAAELNQPLLAIPLKPAKGKLPSRRGFMPLDSEAIILDTVKPAEDGQGLILRLYESHGSHALGRLTLPEGVTKVEAMDLLENPRKESALESVKGEVVTLRLKPFQVVTLRIS